MNRNNYSRRNGRSRGHSRGRAANSQKPDNTPIPEGLVFYCKTCQQIVDYHPTSFNFQYPIENCQKARAKGDEAAKAEMTCNLAYGTERSIKLYYKVKDDKYDLERVEREKRAARADKL